MAVTSDYLQWVLDQVSGVGQISTRRMFGAVGLYQEDILFAIISSDTIYFKVGDANRPDYQSRGARQFCPFLDKPHLSMNYYEVPADILEDAEECACWVRRSVAAALIAKPSPHRNQSQPAAKRRRRTAAP